jgi:23S rRNA pseudouridine2605 synthase
MSEETRPEGSGVREGQRIAKVMARAGVCSRRDAEAWIAQGRVSVNGTVLDSPAFNVSGADDVRVDGKPLGAAERTRLFLLHKPRGLVTTARDPEGRPTVFEALPPGLPRLVAIGRLDINTEGLLLLTNDGGLARVLELPSTGWLRRYRVRAHGAIDQPKLDGLAGGITIDGVHYLGIEARLDREQGDNVWMTLGLREGKNREIKNVLEHLGLEVNRLIRVSFGPFELGDLAEGEAMEVRTRVLRDQLGPKLAEEADADFDAPIIVRDAAPSERSRGERRGSEHGRRENVGHGRASRGPMDRGASRRVFERDEAPRRAPKSSAPQRRRKHVSALRAEIAADAAGPRKRVERGATRDRKGRTIAVERVSPARQGTRPQGDGEKRRRREGRPKANERGGRASQAGARPGRPHSFETGRMRAGEGRGRPPHSDHKKHGRRTEFKPRRWAAEAREDGFPERRFDRSEEKRHGERQNRQFRTRDGATPARERKFNRPQGRKRDEAGGGGPSRVRLSPGRPRRSPRQGSPKGAGGGRRPPRKP